MLITIATIIIITIITTTVIITRTTTTTTDGSDLAPVSLDEDSSRSQKE